MNKEELLYHYFSNSLTPRQEIELNELLERDPDFKKQFEFEKNLQKGLKYQKRGELKKKLAQVETNLPTAPEQKNKKEIKWWYVAASIVVLLAASWFAYNAFEPNYEKLYAANFESYPNTVFTITRSDTLNSTERKAFVAYEAGNYQVAIDNFEEMTAAGHPDKQKDEYVHFYRALSYAQLENTTKAKQLFKEIIAANTSFKDESQWYLALLYLKDKDETNAITSLKALIATGTYQRQKAMKLLVALD